jgi:hypothetical protein
MAQDRVKVSFYETVTNIRSPNIAEDSLITTATVSSS